MTADPAAVSRSTSSTCGLCSGTIRAVSVPGSVHPPVPAVCTTLPSSNVVETRVQEPSPRGTDTGPAPSSTVSVEPSRTITPDGATVYVVNSRSSNVTPIDTATNVAGTPITVGLNPDDIAISADGTTAYVTAVGGPTDNVMPIDLATAKALRALGLVRLEDFVLAKSREFEAIYAQWRTTILSARERVRNRRAERAGSRG